MTSIHPSIFEDPSAPLWLNMSVFLKFLNTFYQGENLKNTRFQPGTLLLKHPNIWTIVLADFLRETLMKRELLMEPKRSWQLMILMFYCYMVRYFVMSGIAWNIMVVTCIGLSCCSSTSDCNKPDSNSANPTAHMPDSWYSKSKDWLITHINFMFP